MSKYLVTYRIWGSTESEMFGSRQGVVEFLKRHPGIVEAAEAHGLTIIEIGREISLSEFVNVSSIPS